MSMANDYASNDYLGVRLLEACGSLQALDLGGCVEVGLSDVKVT